MKNKPQTHSSRSATGQRPNRLVRRSPSPLALEQRFMFDGAAVADAVDTVTKPTDTVTADGAPHLLKIAATETQTVPSELVAAQTQAEKLVTDFLNRSDAKQQMFTLFNGGQTGATPSAEWDAAFSQLMSAFRNGDNPVRVELRSAAELQGAKGAFSVDGTTGQATIYLNADWLAGNGGEIAGADSASIATVLVEELGHYLDATLNKGGDTAGDEGEIFSRFVIDGTNPLSVSYLADQNDHITLQIDGQDVQAELASFNFINAYAMVYDLNNNDIIEGNRGETAAEKEQSTHNFDITGLGAASVNDDTNSNLFSGNDVSAIGINIGGTTYYGWISRPIKSGGIVRGFYFWTDPQFTNLATAQADGNMDGDSNATDNKGFLLVVDQAWFNTQRQTNTTVTLNNIYDGLSRGSVTYATVGSSSDRVDSALNSLITPNSAPSTTNDTLTVSEDAAATLSNVLTNDSDPNGDTLTVTGFSIAGESGPFTLGSSYIIGTKGTITLNTDGSYTFTPIGNYNGPIPAITYTISDGKGGTATATLSINVTPVNDAPTATDDSVTTPEDTTIVLGLNDFGSFSDIDGDTLTKIQITDADSTAHGQLQYWNGSTWIPVTDSQEITVADIIAGKLRFTPAANESGNTYNVISFKVYDGTAYSTNAYTLTVNVTPVNDAPSATTLTGSATEVGCGVAGSNATGSLLSGATDTDTGDTLSVVQVTNESSGQVTSANGTTEVYVQGLYGKLYFVTNGTYRYLIDNSNPKVDALNTGGALQDIFTYRIRDTTGATDNDTLTITINGTNDAPNANDDYSQLQEGPLSGTNYGTVTGNALTNDTDVDNATLSISGSYAAAVGSAQGSSSYSFTVSNSIHSGDYVFFDDDGSAATSTVSATDTAATGEIIKLTVNGHDLLVDQTGSGSTTFKIVVGGVNTPVSLSSNDQGVTFSTNGNFVGFGPNADGSGLYKVSQITGQSNPSSTTVNISSLTSGAIAAGMTVTNGTDTRTVQSVAYDSNGNLTSIVLDSAVTWSGASLTFSSTASPLVLTGQYGEISINTVTGAYTYTLKSNTLNDGQVFTEIFSYRATDGSCTDDTKIHISITGATAPYLVNDTLVVVEDSGTRVSGVTDLRANDSVTSDAITYYYVDGITPINAGTQTNIPDVGFLTVNADGTVVFDPVDNYTGPVPTIKYDRVISSVTYSAYLTITIQPSNDAPVAVDDIAYVTENTPKTGNVLPNDSDPDGDTLTVTQFVVASVTITVDPTNGGSYTINGVGTISMSANGTYTFTPVAHYSGSIPTITYTVSDGHSGTDTADLNLTMLPVSDPPVNTVPATQTFANNYATELTFNSANGNGLSVSDYDGNIRTIVLNVSNGTLSLSNTGHTAVTLNGSGSRTVTLSVASDNEAELNAVLNTLVYTPTSTFSGLDRLTILTTDSTNRSDFDTVDITVNADSRPLTVTGSSVNEASPYMMLKVNGTTGQYVKLELGETGSNYAAGDAEMGMDFLPSLEYFDGAWQVYTGGYVQIADVSGSLLVRTAVLQDSTWETRQSGYETLKLTAYNLAGTPNTNTANTTVDLNGDLAIDLLDQGKSQIKDDGTGSIYLGNNNTGTPNSPRDTDPNGPDYPSYLDDDRPVTVNHIAVNEGSPYAVLTVSGYAGQEVSLAWIEGTANKENGNSSLATDGTEDFGPSLQYWDGHNWVDYNNSSVILGSGGTLLVRTQINQDNVFEQQEAFNLAVTKLSSGVTTYGRVDIYDDGTGQWFDGTGGTGSNTAPSGQVLDDDRPTLSIADVNVEEGSKAVFNVSLSNPTSAAVVVGFALTSGTAGSSDYDTNLSHLIVSYSGGTLTPDAFGRYTVPAGVTSLTVKVVTTSDTTFEGPETFILSANVVDAAINDTDTGTATIYDDGSVDGDDADSIPDDDRTLTVNSISVNEGSPFGVFTVTANKGQTLTLALTNGTAINNTGNSSATDGSVDFGPVLEYSTDNGLHWNTYTAGFTVPGTGTGTASILVRTAIINDTAYENAQGFTLAAGYSSGLPRSTNGTATIHDDGTGEWFNGTSGTGSTTAPAGHTLDDDRAITVTGGNYNENAGSAVFTVHAASGQWLTLNVVDQASPGKAPTGGNEGKPNDSLDNAPIYYSIDGGATWHRYTGPFQAGNQDVLVAVDVTNEADNVYEGEEQLKLIVNEGQSSQSSGYSSLFDDGTGTVTDPINENTRNNTGTDNGQRKDDDRAVPPPPPAIQPVVAPAPIAVALPYGEVRVYIPEVPPLTTPPVEAIKELPALAVVNQVPEQYADSGATSSFALPKDTFVHSDPTETLLFSATLANGQKLPNWIRFDADSGTFQFQAPPDFAGELKIKVTARDSKGNEVSTVFRFNVGKKQDGGRLPAGRASLSEQLRLVGHEVPFALGRVDARMAARVDLTKVAAA